MSAPPQESDQCSYVLGADHPSDERADAWLGFQRAYRELTRELEGSLADRYRLSLSELELLGRLDASDEHRRRLSRLAADIGLSLSRVSRIVDSLARRGLVQRQPYPGDTRATDACLTEAGRTLVAIAQAHHQADVERLFFDRLSADELEQLSAAFARLRSAAAPGGAARAAA